MFGGYHSKFKNIYGDPKKKEECIDQIPLKVKGSDPPLAAVNSKYLAVYVSCSSVDIMVRKLTDVGRVEVTPTGIKLANGIPTCIEWNPRDDDILLVGQLNGEIDLMRIPDDGITESLSTEEAEVAWNCENGSVLNAQWHPTIANGLLTSCGSKFASPGSTQDTHLILWDTNSLAKMIEIPLYNCYLTSLSFNFNGSRVVCTDNSHITRVIDLRLGLSSGDTKNCIIQENMLHKKARRQNTVYLKHNYIFSTGYSESASRQYALWKDENLQDPIELEDLDSNSGFTFPIYDSDINIVYVWGKGDSTIKFMEFLPNLDKNKPTMKLNGAYQSSSPQLGVIAMPKRGVDVHLNEIGRLFKFHNKGFCEFIPIICPRREKGFSEDIYPPTPSIEGSITMESWLEGNDEDPALISLAPIEAGEGGIPTVTIITSKTPTKTAYQKIKEITDIMSSVDLDSIKTVSQYKKIFDDINEIIGLTNNDSTSNNNQQNNGTNQSENIQTNSNNKPISSLDKYKQDNEELEKKGLMNAVKTFVETNPDEEIDDGPNKDVEWDD